MYFPTLISVTAALSSAIGVHGVHIPTFITGRNVEPGDLVARAGPVRYRSVAAPAPERRQQGGGWNKSPLSNNGRCGVEFGTRCGSGECCSSAGWCGAGYLYCSAPSCQFSYSEGCDANQRPQGKDTEDVPRPHIGPVPYGEAIYRCERNGVIALTFDDGPFYYTKDVLDLLKKYGAKATFFITGRNLGKGAINDPQTDWPVLIKRMINDGHQVASHTWSHQRLTTLTQDYVRKQMIFNEIAIADLLGYFPTYMRPPYSASNEQVDQWLGDLGYHITYFNLDTEGYLHDSRGTIQQSKNIWDKAVKGKNPETTSYLQIEHDPVYQTAYNLTEYMLKGLFNNGFKSVTVGECLRDPKENWYRRVDFDRTTPTKRPVSTTSSTPRSTLPPSKDGRCGPNSGDATCLYEPGGTCCSQYGWCGKTTGHCGTGCLSGYGTCGKSL